MTYKNQITDYIHNSRREILICLLLIVATFAVYLQITNHEFINYDDHWLIRDNAYVQKGLSPESVAWAFKSGSGYWKPLTFLSLMLDYEIYGMDAGGFLLTNLLLHILNALLIFLVFKRMTGGGLWQSSFVAMLFALHPLHVESVAWITERKDVLSTLFWMLTMWFYVRYVNRPDVKRYLPVILCFILGLMAKPMVVTLPFVLLLLDYWPLKRPQLHPGGIEKPELSIKNWALLVREKIPLFVFSAISVYMTLPIFSGAKELPSYAIELSFAYKIQNAFISYVSYIGKMFWPFHLAIPYPCISISTYSVIGACVLLLIITFFAVKTAKSRPYFVIGWFWYLGTLLPVIGLINFSPVAMADRFTYVPLVGLFIIVTWGAADIFQKFRYKKIGLPILYILLVVILMHRTWVQAGYWENSYTLFEHTLKITDNNNTAHQQIGYELERLGRIPEAIEHFRRSLAIEPDNYRVHNNLGKVLVKAGQSDEAGRHFNEALRLFPFHIEALNNIGNIALSKGKINEAINYYQKALMINPEYAPALLNMGIAKVKKSDFDQAIIYFSKTLELNPDNYEAQRYLKYAQKLKNDSL